MNNNFLKYMLDNNPDNTISKEGIKRRNKLRPILLKILKLSNKLDLIVEKNEFKGSDRPIIYIASHAFKDDAVNTVLTAKCDANIVVGNIDLFFNTLDGFFLWLYGCQLVDRYDKNSKHAMKDKMNRILEYGSNILIFPEATWNLSPNKLMYNLHWGFYDVAKKNNAVVVPIITYKVGKKCYSRMLSEIDVTSLTNQDKVLIDKRSKKYINKSIDLFMINNEYIKNKLLNIKYLIFNNADLSVLNNEINDIVKILKEIRDEKNFEIIDLVIKYLLRITTVEKEVVTERIRDIMGTEKYDMISLHPDNSFEKGSSTIYEEWDKYLDETINATPYFYLEPEKTTEQINELENLDKNILSKKLK